MKKKKEKEEPNKILTPKEREQFLKDLRRVIEWKNNIQKTKYENQH